MPRGVESLGKEVGIKSVPVGTDLLVLAQSVCAVSTDKCVLQNIPERWRLDGGGVAHPRGIFVPLTGIEPVAIALTLIALRARRSTN